MKEKMVMCIAVLSLIFWGWGGMFGNGPAQAAVDGTSRSSYARHTVSTSGTFVRTPFVSSPASVAVLPVIGTAGYFRFDYPPYPQTFVIKLTDPAKIQEARDILSGRQTDAVHVAGVIVKEAASYNSPWSYQLDPATIIFFDRAIEVCDANIQAVEGHLEEVGGSFLPNSRWCPWGSRLREEVIPVAHALRVNSGTGSGSYVAGKIVRITANPAIATKVFDQWTGDVAYVSDVHSASAIVTMPDRAITLSATYRYVPAPVVSLGN